MSGAREVSHIRSHSSPARACAIRPYDLGDLVQVAITQDLPPERFSTLTAAEALERKTIRKLVVGMAS
jgi:hypothetical protein